jgi:hypothetical protein
MDLNKPISGNLTHQFIPMEEGRKSLTRGLTSALQKRRQVAQLPDENTLFKWSDVDIDAHNAEIIETVAQYENRDHDDSMIVLREQNALLARLAWEQQIHICDLNERYLKLAEEKKNLVETEDDEILDNMVDMTNLMTNLRESLEQRQQTISEIWSPIDLSKILATIKKLKSALLDTNVSNTSLVNKNNSLQIELSFMPEEMREKIGGAPLKREDQRTDPHYLIPDGNRFVFQRANPNDPIVSELQTCSYYMSVNHLLNEANDVMNITKTHDTEVDVDHGIDEECYSRLRE